MKACTILLQTHRPEAFSACVAEFERLGCGVDMVADAQERNARLRADAPRLVLVDAASDDEARSAVLDIMKINALVHTAVVTALAPEVFHDVMEGLGILTSVPQSPSAADAQRILELLEKV